MRRILGTRRCLQLCSAIGTVLVMAARLPAQAATRDTSVTPSPVATARRGAAHGRIDRQAWLLLGFGIGWTREYGMTSGPPHYDTLYPTHYNELGTMGTIGVEFTRGRAWGGTRLYSIETELLSDSKPNPLGFALYGGVQQRTVMGTLRAALGVDVVRVGPYAGVAVDWFTDQRVGLGLEGFGVAGSESVYGASLRLRIRLAP